MRTFPKSQVARDQSSLFILEMVQELKRQPKEKRARSFFLPFISLNRKSDRGPFFKILARIIIIIYVLSTEIWGMGTEIRDNLYAICQRIEFRGFLTPWKYFFFRRDFRANLRYSTSDLNSKIDTKENLVLRDQSLEPILPFPQEISKTFLEISLWTPKI